MHLCLHAVPPLRRTTISFPSPTSIGQPSLPMTRRPSFARGLFDRRITAQSFPRPTARHALCATPSMKHGAFAPLATPLSAWAAYLAIPEVVADSRTLSSRSLNLMCTVWDDGLQRPPSKVSSCPWCFPPLVCVSRSAISSAFIVTYVLRVSSPEHLPL